MIEKNTENLKVNNGSIYFISSEIYQNLILFVSFLSFGLSIFLSIIFWWSIGGKLVESVLFLMFALVFELCKFISLPMAMKHSKQGRMFTLNLAIYLLLTILSVLSSIGGIGSCFSNNEAQAIQSSSEYQTITHQIESKQALINNELGTVQTDLAHNYRTQAQVLMEKEIPQQQQVLDQLRQQRDNIHGTALPPSLTLLKIFSESFSVSFDHIENIFVTLIAILIEVISTYLMIISLTTKEASQNQLFQVSETFSERSETLQKPPIIRPCEEIPVELENLSRKVPETINTNSTHSKSFLEKYEQVLKNIENKIYHVNITQIMSHEKIGYPKAKQILQMLQHGDNQTNQQQPTK